MMRLDMTRGFVGVTVEGAEVLSDTLEWSEAGVAGSESMMKVEKRWT